MLSETDTDLLLQDILILMSNFSKMKQWELMLQKIKLPPSCINWYFSGKHSWEADNWTNNPCSRNASAVVGFISLQNSCDKAGKREKASHYTQTWQVCYLPMFLYGRQCRIECKWTKITPKVFLIHGIIKNSLKFMPHFSLLLER